MTSAEREMISHLETKIGNHAAGDKRFKLFCNNLRYIFFTLTKTFYPLFMYVFAFNLVEPTVIFDEFPSTFIA